MPRWRNWYTRATQNRMPQGLRVRLPPEAQMKKPKVVIVVGPTASGKTALSIALAKRFSGEVISADSRQIYRKLDIGTAKVTDEEMSGISHHLIDIADIDTVYSAADFKRDAEQAIAEITNRGHVPVIAGGTFFYVDTLLGKQGSPAVAPSPELRERLEKLSVTELFAQLQEKDPERAANIDAQNPRRLIRALEIVDAVGKVPSTEELSVETPYDALVIGIKRDTSDLRERFYKRAQAWLQAGFQSEVENLLQDGVTRERLHEMGFEYQLMLALIDGTITKEEFYEKFVQKNWQYAKRQMMWLKRDESIVWFEAGDEKVFTVVEEFLGNKIPTKDVL